MAPRYNTTASSLFRLLLLALLQLVCVPAVPCLGQPTLQLVDVTPTRFPTVTGRFYLFDGKGQQVTNLSPADVSVTENSIPRKVVRVSCPPPVPQQPISAVLTIDISGSMSQPVTFGMTRMDIVRAAATAWVQEMGSTSECAITSFNLGDYLNRDFTNDKQKLLAALSQLTPQGGTDYMAGFLGYPAGGLRVARRGTQKRVLVFLTDGLVQLPTDENAIVAEAKQSNTEVYCIALAMPIPTVLKNISERTGGESFGMVTSVQEAVAIYRTILRQAENIEPCEVEWESEFECSAGRNVSLLVPEMSLSSPGYYTAPESSVKLMTTPTSLAFGPVAPGTDRSLDILLTAVGGTVAIDSVVSSDPRFTVTQGGAPPGYVIGVGMPGTVRVQFAPTDSQQVFSEIRIYSSSCKPNIVRATGGFYGKAAQTPLRLLTPNGGERFVAGTDTVMTWTGVLPSTQVRLEYSTDTGTTWQTITSIGSDYSHAWHVPNTPSRTCLARVSESRAQSPVLTLDGHSGTVRDANFSHDGASVVTVEYDGTIRVFDAVTGILVQTLSSHPAALAALFNPDGDQILTGGADRTVRRWDLSTGSLMSADVVSRGAVYGLAYNALGTLVATGGADTAVKVWSSAIGSAPLWVYPVAWPVRSVAFSPGSNRIVAGSDDSLARVWSVVSRNLDLVLGPHRGPVTSVEFSPDGSRVLTADAEGVYLWDVGTGTQMWHTTLASVSTARFSPDGGRVAVGTGADVCLLEAYQGTILRTLSGHAGNVVRTSFSPDGQRVVSASEDRTARIWDLNDLPIQHDESDALWEIVAPNLVSFDVDFGTVALGSSRDSVVVGYIKNLGTLPTRVDRFTFKGGVNGEFTVISGGPPFTLGPDETRTVELEFRPVAVGLRQSNIEISTGAAVLVQSLRGVGVALPLEISSTLVDFGAVAVGDKKDSTVALLVRNTGASPLTITGTSLAGPDNDHFSIIQGGGTVTLQPGEGHDMVLRFSPTETGGVSGSIAFEYGDVGSPARALLYGEGVDEGILLPSIDALPTRELRLDGCSDDLLDTVVVANTGRAPLRIDSIRLAGPDASRFSLPVSLDGASVEPRDSLRVPLRFSSSIAGRYTTSLLVASNDPIDSLHRVDLSADRRLPDFRLSIDTVDFGMLCPGEFRDTSVVLSNTGAVALDVAGTSESLFAVDGAVLRLDTAMSEPVEVHFAGSSEEGGIVGEIVFVDTACGVRRVLVVTADVVAPRIEVESVELVSNGGRKVEGDVVVRNTSKRDLRLDDVRIDGVGLRVIGDPPKEIAAGDETTLRVEYEGGGRDTVDYEVMVDGSPCGVVGSGTVRVVLRRAWTRVEVGGGEGLPGDRVKIPLRMTEAQGVEELELGGYRAEVRFDRSVLLPVGRTPLGTIDGDDRVIVVSGEGTGGSVGELDELEFVVGLGRVDSTSVRLSEFAWGDTTVGVERVDGRFAVLGVCGEPTSRLYRSDGRVGLKSVGVGIGGEELTVEYEVVEPGETELYLVDMLGRRVKELSRGTAIPGWYEVRAGVGELGTGLYLCVMRTPSRIVSAPIEVCR